VIDRAATFTGRSLLTRKMLGIEERSRDRRQILHGSNGAVCRLGRMVMAAVPDHISGSRSGPALGPHVRADGARIYRRQFATPPAAPRPRDFLGENAAGDVGGATAVKPTTRPPGFLGATWSGGERMTAHHQQESQRSTERQSMLILPRRS